MTTLGQRYRYFSAKNFQKTGTGCNQAIELKWTVSKGHQVILTPLKLDRRLNRKSMVYIILTILYESYRLNITGQDGHQN